MESIIVVLLAIAFLAILFLYAADRLTFNGLTNAMAILALFYLVVSKMRKPPKNPN